ncbi:hypothetical protein ACLOJK_032566 [Asimina triloba]
MAAPFTTLIVLFSISTIMPSAVEAQPQGTMIARICRAVLEQDLSTYSTNFLESLFSVQLQVEEDGFGAADEGKPPQRAFLLAQCMGDLTPHECASCFSDIKRFISGCFPSIGGRVYMDGCFIRAENYSFYNEAVTKDDTKACGDVPSNGASYADKVRRLIHDLVNKAPRNKGFSKGYQNLTGGAAFGLANCWKTLNESVCESCLENAAAKALSCLPAKEGRGLNAGCFVRYTDVEIFQAGRGIMDDPRMLSALILSIVVTTAISATAIALGVWVGKVVYNRVHNQKGLDGLDMESSVVKGSMRFKYSTLEKATSFFSHANKLGQGGSGETETDPERKKELDWKKRRGIIIGVAEGLEYLHKDCKVKIVHRDIKPSNILLDERFRPKIGDFGLARLFLGKGGLKNTLVAGTLGYMAPEYLARGQLTEKVDIYSFGVLVLEVIGGIQMNKFTAEASAMDTLVTAAWTYYKSDTLLRMVDKGLQLDDTEEAEVIRVAKVGLLCTQEVASLRPSMTEVIQMITKGELPVPKPTKPPFVDDSVELSYLLDSPSLPLQSSHSNSYDDHTETGPQ